MGHWASSIIWGDPLHNGWESFRERIYFTAINEVEGNDRTCWVNSVFTFEGHLHFFSHDIGTSCLGLKPNFLDIVVRGSNHKDHVTLQFGSLADQFAVFEINEIGSILCHKFVFIDLTRWVGSFGSCIKDEPSLVGLSIDNEVSILITGSDHDWLRSIIFQCQGFLSADRHLGSRHVTDIIVGIMTSTEDVVVDAFGRI
jgi:hypothetical protein